MLRAGDRIIVTNAGEFVEDRETGVRIRILRKDFAIRITG